MVEEGRELEVPASSGFSDKILEISCDCMQVYEGGCRLSSCSRWHNLQFL